MQKNCDLASSGSGSPSGRRNKRVTAGWHCLGNGTGQDTRATTTDGRWHGRETVTQRRKMGLAGALAIQTLRKSFIMKKSSGTIVALLLLVTCVRAESERPYLFQKPAISRTQVAFVYGGDL